MKSEQAPIETRAAYNALAEAFVRAARDILARAVREESVSP